MFGNSIKRILSAVVVSAGAVFLSPIHDANAQINIQIGMSEAKAKRILINNGFSQIELYRKGFKTANARACKDGIRYDVKVDTKQRVRDVRNIGACRNQVNSEQIKRNLEANGYSRVVIDEQNGYYVAVGCKEQVRNRLIYSQQGQVKQVRKIGRCEVVLQPSDVKERLREMGYNRIVFIDLQLPKYVAEACRNGRKFELNINRFAEIRQERRIGRCAPPINPRNLIEVMEEKGYDRVEVIDARLPRYQVEACFENDRMNVTLNEYGTITSREIIGRCNTAVTQEQIVTTLKQEGFKRINVERTSRGGFDVRACLEGNLRLVKLNRYGELLSEDNGGFCESYSLNDIAERLQDRGYKGMKFYVEACRNGHKYRVAYDEFGDRKGRRRIGSC